MQALETLMAGHLAAFPRLAITRDDLRRAAVAILVCPLEDGRPGYALTRRALTLRRGAGNYALPGGACDPGEDAVDAALRETAEELGVFLGREAALGLLDDFVTLSGFVVTPVVLFSPTTVVLRPDPAEVGEAWFNPLEELDHPEAPRGAARPRHPGRRRRSALLDRLITAGGGTASRWRPPDRHSRSRPSPAATPGRPPNWPPRTSADRDWTSRPGTAPPKPSRQETG